jgi:NAD-dependent dihydropyrimidine dehydrogenase PreA subunit
MIVVDEEKCDGCGSCVEVCPNEVLEVQDGISVVVNPDDCVECESCVAECPNEAITLE